MERGSVAGLGEQPELTWVTRSAVDRGSAAGLGEQPKPTWATGSAVLMEQTWQMKLQIH